MARKDFLDIVSLDRQEIIDLLDQAEPFKDLFTRSVKKVPALKGKTVLMLFYEPSTRTLSSFEVAAKRLSADVTIFDVPHSSVTKGESVRDTIDTLQAMRADYIVVRHKLSGQPAAIARQTGASVINAGDGAHAHPTQGLLDAFTFREKFPEMEGRKVLITGDILHSRVARSTSTILRKLGVDVAFLGPGSLVPKNTGIQRFTDYDQAIKEFAPEAVYLLRVQKERMGAPFFPSDREYHSLYGITEERLHQLEGDGTYIMHPGPINRGVELCDAVLDYERCLISQQVENGIAARMSVLYGLKPQTS
ncbi:MAG: aspartate carbamoyltransferase catalytic subunit [Akkermansiaceae bacterium]